MRKLLKTTVRNIALLLASTIIAVLIGEFFIRMVAPQRLEYFPDFYRPDSTVGFRLVKNYAGEMFQEEFAISVRTNAVGIRDHDVGRKDSGSVRIVGLGDSFVFGNGVNIEETYLKQLESMLNDSIPEGERFEVLNAGVPSWGIYHAVRYFEREGMQLEPDLVLLGIYMGNDLLDSREIFENNGRSSIRIKDGILLAADMHQDYSTFSMRLLLQDAWLSWSRFVKTNSHLWMFFRSRLKELAARGGIVPLEDPPSFCARQYSPEQQRGLEIAQILIKELHEFTRAQGMGLHVVLIPTHYQVYPSMWEKYVKAFSINSADYDLDKAQRLMKEFCSQEGIGCTDLLPGLRTAAADISDIYFTLDTHLTVKGNAVVASLIYRDLGHY